MTREGALLDRTAVDLLELLAAGRNTPGAGSAAALAGALAGSLLQAVARYSVRSARKPGADDAFLERAESLLEEIGERTQSLSRAVEEDATAFERYWREKDPEALAVAIEIPVAIAEQGAGLAATGLELYDRGFRPARGEASTAVLLALASAESAAYVARLNLKLEGALPGAAAQSARLNALEARLQAMRSQIGERLSGPCQTGQ